MSVRLSLLLFFSFWFCGAIAQNSDFFEQGDTVYVWAVNGIVLRAEPNLNGKIIRKLSFGQQLLVEQTFEEVLNYEVMPAVTRGKQVTPAIIIRGIFIRIKIDGTEGYVFDGLLSRLKPAVPGEGFEKYFERIYGQLKILADTKSDYPEHKFRRIIYKNGAIVQKENGSSWWNYSYFIPDLTLREAFIVYNGIMNFEHYYKQSLDIPGTLESRPVSFGENKITLQHGYFDTTEITNLNKFILISSEGGN